MITGISATLSSIKIATDLIKSAIDGHDEGIANKAIQEIHAKLTELSIGHLSLIEKATSLSNENATLKAENLDLKQKLFQHEKKVHDLANYERHTTLRACGYTQLTPLSAVRSPRSVFAAT